MLEREDPCMSMCPSQTSKAHWCPIVNVDIVPPPILSARADCFKLGRVQGFRALRLTSEGVHVVRLCQTGQAACVH